MKNYFGYIGGSLLLLASCKVPQLPLQQQQSEVPNAFDTLTSTSNVKNIQELTYDTYFADPYLKQLISVALTDNLDYAIAQKRLDIATAVWRKSNNAFLPSISGIANASATKYGKYTMEGVGNFDTNLSPNIEDKQKISTNPTPNYWLGLGADWEIDIWGKLRNMKKSAKARYFATAEGKKLIEATLVSEVIAMYYDIIALDQEIAILENNITLQEQALEVVKLHQEVGRATLLAVKQMASQVYNAKAILAQKQNDREIAIQAMNALLGRYDGDIERSKEIIIPAVQYLYNYAIPTQVMQTRPDVKQALLELEASHAYVKAARTAFFPTVNIGAQLAFNAFSGEMLFNPASIARNVMGGLVAPIFNKSQIRNDFKIATAQQEIAYLEFEKIAMQAYREVNTLLKNVQYVNEAYVNKSNEVKTIAEGVDISQDLYMNGYANYLELITARKSKLDAEMEIIDLKRNQIRNIIKLYKALGGGYNN
jgi:multidrug efflux system outer membrane protein